MFFFGVKFWLYGASAKVSFFYQLEDRPRRLAGTSLLLQLVPRLATYFRPNYPRYADGLLKVLPACFQHLLIGTK
jgi:hypothetical protein